MGFANKRDLFPALSTGAIYFDGPSGSQVPSMVSEAMIEYMQSGIANVGSVYTTSKHTQQIVYNARLAAKDLYNSVSSKEIIFAANATSLCFHVARSIADTWQQGDEILLSDLDHFANVSPWLIAAQQKGVKVHRIPVLLPEGKLDIGFIKTHLNSKTRLLACTYASNVLGSFVDLEMIIALLKQYSKALSFIDAVHATPHKSIDVQALDCDFLVSSAYKFFGPSLGILYAKQTHLDKFEPYKVDPAPDYSPYKWELGSLNFTALAGFIACVDYLAAFDESQSGTNRCQRIKQALDAINSYENVLSQYLLLGFSAFDELKLYGSLSPLSRTPTFAFNVKGRQADRIVDYFATKNIYIAHGDFYAKRLCHLAGLSEQGGFIRLGCMHYNTLQEITTFFNELKICLSRKSG